jgi:transcriptional regulator with GAF, ATPase, and Fis domain
MTSTEAIAILRERSGSMYDATIVEKFLEIRPEEALRQDATPASAALTAITEAVQSDAARRRSDTGPSYDRSVLEVVYRLGAMIPAATDAGVMTERLHEALGQFMPAGSTAIYLYDPAADALIARHVSGQHAAAVSGLVIANGQRLTGWVAAQRTTVVNSDAALDLGNLTMRLSPPPHTCLSTALTVDGELVGAITVYSTSAEPFTDRHAALLEVLAPKVAAAARKDAIEHPVNASTDAAAERPAATLLRFAR